MPAPRLAACLLLPLLAACATAPAALPADPLLTAMIGRMPTELGSFVLQESRVSTGGAAAWTFRYAHAPSGTQAAVMLGPPDLTAVDGPSSAAVQETVNSVSLLIQARTGGGGLTRSPDFGAAAIGQPPEIRCSDLKLQQPQGQVRRVLVCATGLSGRVAAVSLVAQHPADASDAARLFMTGFALQAMRALRGDGDAAPDAGGAVAPASGRVFRL